MIKKKFTEWERYEEKARNMSVVELLFSIEDCRKASLASRGWNPENEGYYDDEASVYFRELRKRQLRGYIYE